MTAMPPYQIADPGTENMMQELYRRVCIIEQGLGISTGATNIINETTIVLPPNEGPVIFKVDEIDPIQYFSVNVTANHLWKWWETVEGLPITSLPGSLSPIKLFTLKPGIEGRAARALLVFGYVQGEIFPSQHDENDNISSYDLHIGPSIDSITDFFEARNTSKLYGSWSKGNNFVLEATRISISGVSFLYDIEFTTETDIYAAFWTEISPFPSGWNHADGVVQIRGEIVTHDIPIRVKLSTLLGEPDQKTPVIYVRKGSVAPLV